MKPKIILVAAMDSNGAIGFNGNLPWVCSTDLKHFAKITNGKVVLMGRKTAESLPKALKNRVNLVLTRDTSWTRDGFIPVYDMWDVRINLKKSKTDELWVIGGGELYRKFIDQAMVVHLSIMDIQVPEADTYFPVGKLDKLFKGRFLTPCKDPLVKFWVMNREIESSKSYPGDTSKPVDMELISPKSEG